MIHFEQCERCGELVPKGSLRWTKDADGNWVRRVCRSCLMDIRAFGYDVIKEKDEEEGEG